MSKKSNLHANSESVFAANQIQKQTDKELSQKLNDVIENYPYQTQEIISQKSVNELENTTGKWIKYPQGSNHRTLTESLQEYEDRWYTETAEFQLKTCDFYVYYSHDKKGEATIPRTIIRIQSGSIVEVRGMAYEQNIDSYIGSVVNNKLKTFPDGDKYQKKVADMKRLTTIDQKTQIGTDLTQNDLKFLYEINTKIDGFGNKPDPRISKIKNNRNQKEDYVKIYECKKSQVIENLNKLDSNTKVHLGHEIYNASPDITLNTIKKLSQIKGLKANLTDIAPSIKNQLTRWKDSIEDRSEVIFYSKLQSIKGNLTAYHAKTFKANSLQLAEMYLEAYQATIFEINALQSVGNDLDASSAIIFEANALQSVGNDLNANSTKTFETNTLQSVGGDLDTSNATSFKANALLSVGKNLQTNSAIIFEANALQLVGVDLHADSAPSFKANALLSVGKILRPKSAKIFEANALQSVGGSLQAMRTTTFKANALQSVGASLFAGSVKTFKANALQSVESFLGAESAVTFEANNLQSVGMLNISRATTFRAPNLKKIEKIILTRSLIKDEDIDLPKTMWDQIEWK